MMDIDARKKVKAKTKPASNGNRMVERNSREKSVTSSIVSYGNGSTQTKPSKLVQIVVVVAVVINGSGCGWIRNNEKRQQQKSTTNQIIY